MTMMSFAICIPNCSGMAQLSALPARIAYLVYIEGLSCAKVPTSLTTPNSTAANAPRGT